VPALYTDLIYYLTLVLILVIVFVSFQVHIVVYQKDAFTVCLGKILTLNQCLIIIKLSINKMDCERHK